MFRFEVGTRILVKQHKNPEHEAIEVEILNKVPNMIKAKVLSDGWFSMGSIHWLSANDWFTTGRVTPNESS